MTVRSVPIFLQAGSHPAEETRLMLGAMLSSATGSFAGGVASADPAHGVINTGDLEITENGTPNMSVNVAAGGAFIRGTLNANQGAYHVWNDGTVNLPISAADVTNGRRDLVIAQVRDAAYSGADNDARITVVTGTPAAVPADPSLASFPNALVLARITVAAGDTAINTADITDLRPLANQSGKMPVFTTQALATTAIPSPVDGQAYYLNSGTATEGTLWWHGSAYRPSWNMPWGQVGRTELSANTTGITTGTDLTGGTLTFTAVANRLYRVESWVYLVTSTAQSSALLSVLEGATNIILAGGAYTPVGTGVHIYGTRTTTFTAGSHTLKLRGSVLFGAGSVGTSVAPADRPDFISVTDVGPSGAPA
jgi:hypothetical protein